MPRVVTSAPAEDTVSSVSAGSNVTDLEIPGLDGNADGRYYLEGVIHVPASVAHVYTFRPNGLTTNLSGVQSDNEGTATTSTDWRIAPSVNESTPVAITFRAWIGAQTTVGGVATRRTFDCLTLVTHGNSGETYQYSYRCTGVWRETSTNLTSLNLVSSVASGILQGSSIHVYRAGEAYA